MNRKPYLPLILAALLALCLPAALVGAQAATPVVETGQTLTGTLNVINGDPQDPAGQPIELYFLADGAGGFTPLLIDDAGRATIIVQHLNGQAIIVVGRPATTGPAPAAVSDGAVPFEVESIRPASDAQAGAAAVTGNTKWLTIACKFPDLPPESYTIEYFQEMYRNSKPGLDHYWRETSYNTINLAGSVALGWYTLPHPYEWYFAETGSFSLTDSFRDCAAAADPFVYFPDYYGINIVLGNDDLATAWGGRIETILDGIRHVYPTTWMTQWTLGWISEFEHEMGHAYGLWHSYSGLSAYGNPWDVMSRDDYNCDRFSDPVYGCYGQHTIARNKSYLGWIPPERIYNAGPGTHTITLERTAQPGPSGYLMARIPIDGSSTDYYTVEARHLVGYDEKLPGPAIILHRIDEDSPYIRWIDLVSVGGVGSSFQGVGDGRNVMWLPGETYAAPEGGIVVNVISATPTGFTITIHSGWSSRTTILTPTDDTYVRRTNPNTNYGSEPVLKAEPGDSTGWINTWSALRFDPAAIPETTYRLRLVLAVVDDGGASVPGEVYQLNPAYVHTSTPWAESGLTYNKMGDRSPLWAISTRSGLWLDHDITYGFGWLGIQGVSSLALDGQNAIGLVQLSSKEGGNPPQLIVDYLVPPDEPTTTTFLPTNDAYVSQAKPKNVFGGKTALQVKNAAKDADSYLKFNVRNLPGGGAVGHVAAVRDRPRPRRRLGLRRLAVL